MSQEATVLFANEAFYIAFAGRDADGMDAVWATREQLTCIHPGWPPLTGRKLVMRSWREILSKPTAPDIRCDSARAYVNGDTAYVICTERLSGGELVATNIFVREAGAWKLVHHQAAPAPMPPSTDPQDTRHILQ